MTTVTDGVTGAEGIARRFHEEYEARAPLHGYQTRKASAVPWRQVPDNNRALMVDVVKALIENGDICPTRGDAGITIPHALFGQVLAALDERRECGCLDCGEGIRCEEAREPEALYWRWWSLGPEAASYALDGDHPTPGDEGDHVPSSGQTRTEADVSPAAQGDGPTTHGGRDGDR